MYSQVTVKIESRVHLLSTLAEAAELEHDLMCMYLYPVFSFKTTTAEGLTVEEMDAVHGWRKTLLAWRSRPPERGTVSITAQYVPGDDGCVTVVTTLVTRRGISFTPCRIVVTRPSWSRSC